MLVHGAIIPPRSVLAAVADVVRSVREPVVQAEPEEAPQAKGLLGKLGRRRAEDPVPPVSQPMLEHVALEQMRLPITGFGNLTTNDVNRLVEAVKEAAAGWSPPVVRFAGGTALDFPGDWSVWAKLEGDVEELMAVGRGVPQSVERLGFFVDRRQFRPMLSLATVTPATTGPFLEQLVGALDAFRGDEWTAEISLTKETFVDGRPVMSELERIPLGS
jgi:RNA 2',3'-cyclic 3'-phosphodiesterase